ncbi:MAG: Rieske (2Fe-2S) protein [Verrucomicrobia bacterium]|nr:Rieske (2Fe-2S) protein [Verrucomicrobiota bacterium]
MGDESQEPSSIDRRHFLALMAAGLAPVTATAKGEQVVDVGPASLYAANGVYDKFRDLGFFLVQEGGKLKALSSYCTHRTCKLKTETNHTFSCPCHGSTFSDDGKVLQGPAKKDLPIFPTNNLSNGHLGVSLVRTG